MDWINKATDEEKLKLENYALKIELMNIQQMVFTHDHDEFLKKLEEKYKEKKDGND